MESNAVREKDEYWIERTACNNENAELFFMALQKLQRKFVVPVKVELSV
ncbi:MAG TPA: hypothetical protein PLY16_00040 [Candidatus Saccharibacteria bacterium]|nr:hypothetical protein [Candidatus Saccharibacteria bacterium]